MKFRDFKLAHKQYIGFDFILILMAIVSIYAINRMAMLRDQIDEVSNNWLPRSLAISAINKNTSDFRLNQLQHALARDEAGKKIHADRMNDLVKEIEQKRANYDTLMQISVAKGFYSEEEKAFYDRFEEHWDEYQGTSFDFFFLSRDNESEAALAVLTGEAASVFNELSENLRQLAEANKRDAFRASQRAEQTYFNAKKVAIFLFVVTIGLAILFTSMLIRFITVPVQELDQAAQTVAAGNLEVSLPVRSKDEIGNLANSFNRMTLSLKEATERLQEQAKKLQEQNDALQKAHMELAEKSARLEKQNTEIEQKNSDLEKQKIEILNKNLELHQAMEQLRNTQQQLLMKEKMASLGDLVAGIAHEINNPIGTVTSSVDVTGRCLQKIEIVLEQSKNIEEIRHNIQLPKVMKLIKENIRVTMIAGQRIATIVKSLKNFARLDESAYQVVDIHDGLESTLTLMSNEFRGRIDVAREYAKLPKLGCYPSELNQVFMSLLKNASQAIAERGKIAISTQRENGHVLIKIKDSGKGISRERIGTIFDFNFSAGDKRVKMASGLTTAFNIIQKHQGEIFAESEEGKGATFTILLPIRQVES